MRILWYVNYISKTGLKKQKVKWCLVISCQTVSRKNTLNNNLLLETFHILHYNCTLCPSSIILDETGKFWGGSLLSDCCYTNV